MARIGLLIPGMQYGGAERVAGQLAAHWDLQGHQVTLITLSRADSDSYPLPDSVTRVGLDLQRPTRGLFSAVLANLRRIRSIRRALQADRCEVAVSLTDTMNVLASFACRVANIPIVVSERTDPRHHPLSSIWRRLRNRAYAGSDAVVVQTESVRRWVVETCGASNVYVIPNGVAKPRLGYSGACAARRSHPRVLAVGRLSPEKGFDRLIDAFARCSRHNGLRLEILGEGPERRALTRRIHHHGLEDAVTLHGWVDDVTAFMLQSDVFVLPSHYEGFPNGLLEAMNCGLPVVAFDCPSGPREIVRDGVDGILVPNDDLAALTAAIERLMDDDPLRSRMGHEALEVRRRFSLERSLKLWDDVVADVLRSAGGERQSR